MGAGAGAVILGGGVVAWLGLRRDPDAPLPPTGDGFVDAKDAPNSTGSGIPATADGPSNLAVAWWPQDISLEQDGADATLRFQSTIANVGGRAEPIRFDDRVEYTVRRTDDLGADGQVVGHGSAPLTRADVQPFPVGVGSEIGHDVSSFGRDLEPVHSLGPATAAIVGSQHPEQAISIADARAGTYQLRQEIVRADGGRDATAFDDVRLTEFILDGHGGILHTSSRYDGPDMPTTTGQTP